MKIHREELKCRVVTPMFCYGADKNNPEIRPSAIKSLIRFWDRALYPDADLYSLGLAQGKRYGNTLSTKKLKSHLSKIRHTAAPTLPKETMQQKSSVEVEVFPVRPGGCIDPFTNSPTIKTTSSKAPKPFDLNVLNYFAFGPFRMIKRDPHYDPYIQPDTDFTIRLSSKSPTDLKRALHILKIASCFSGIGSKARNGYGRFEIIGNQASPLELFTQFAKGPKNAYTSFSESAKLYEHSSYAAAPWYLSLGEMGKGWMVARREFEKRHQNKKRQYLASPLNIPQDMIKSFLDRHAKSHFFFLHPVGKDRYQGMILFLPYLYLENAHFDADMKKKIRKSELSISEHRKKYNAEQADFHEHLTLFGNFNDITPS